jgi:hypothetical protein
MMILCRLAGYDPRVCTRSRVSTESVYAPIRSEASAMSVPPGLFSRMEMTPAYKGNQPGQSLSLIHLTLPTN